MFNDCDVDVDVDSENLSMSSCFYCCLYLFCSKILVLICLHSDQSEEWLQRDERNRNFRTFTEPLPGKLIQLKYIYIYICVCLLFIGLFSLSQDLLI